MSAHTKAEKEHMSRVAALGCIVCFNAGREYVPCEIDHILDQKNRDRNHMRVIGLCPIHHRTGILHRDPSGFTGWQRWREVGYHQAPREFTRRYGTKRELLLQVKKLLGE